MATATKKKPAAKPILDVPVTFGARLSMGEETINIPMKIDRAALNIMAADEALVGRQVTGRLIVCPHGEDSQETIVDDLYPEVAGVFKIKRIGVSRKEVSCSAVFDNSVEVEDLRNFCGRTGRLLVELVQPLEDPSPEDAGDDEEEDEE